MWSVATIRPSYTGPRSGIEAMAHRNYCIFDVRLFGSTLKRSTCCSLARDSASGVIMHLLSHAWILQAAEELSFSSTLSLVFHHAEKLTRPRLSWIDLATWIQRSHSGDVGFQTEAASVSCRPQDRHTRKHTTSLCRPRDERMSKEAKSSCRPQNEHMKKRC